MNEHFSGKLPRNVHTCSYDFLLGDVTWMDLAGKLKHSCVGVFICMRINISLQRLQLLWRGADLLRLVRR